jgi:hypothetical protein
VKKELLARGEDEIGAAINALKYLIREFHGRLPQNRELAEIGHDLWMCRSRFPVSYVVQQQGPGPHKPWRLSGLSSIGRPEAMLHRHPTVPKSAAITFLRSGRSLIYCGGDSNGAANARRLSVVHPDGTIAARMKLP